MVEITNVAGIAWDLDGTLLDSFGIYEQVLTEVVEAQGHKMPTREVIQHNYHGSLEDSIQAALGLDSAEAVAEAYDLFLSRQVKHYEGDLNLHLFNDATQLAQDVAAKGIPQMIITNRFHEGRGSASPRAIVAATVLADCINEIRCGDELEYTKPDKRSIQDWVEANNILPEQLLVIGDQHVDAALAANLGCRALLVGRNGDIPHLSSDERSHVTITESLDNVQIN